VFIKDVSYEELKVALDKANEKFQDNIKFKKIAPANRAWTRWTVTLGVIDSHKAGGRRSSSGRRIAAACWHAHGEFLDALPPYARYRSVHTGEWLSPGQEWVDYNLGSQYMPFYASEACDC